MLIIKFVLALGYYRQVAFEASYVKTIFSFRRKGRLKLLFIFITQAYVTNLIDFDRVETFAFIYLFSLKISF